MYEASRVDTVPKAGPFALVPGFLRHHALKLPLGALLALTIGVVGEWYVSTQVREILRVRKTWSEGVVAAGEVVVDGKVTTTNLLLPSYNLDVTFSSADGNLRTVDVKFDRLFGGPDEGDAIELRYLALDPDQAATSWQWDARYHMWFLQAFGACFMFVFLLFGVQILRETVPMVLRFRRLARSGHLDAVPIIDSKRVGPDVEIQYVLAGQSPGIQTFALNGGGPMMFDGTRAIGLVSPDSKQVLLLAADGWPLAWPLRPG